MQMASSGSTAASPDIVTDQNAGKGQDNFEAWDADTQKQWKQFLKGSRSQEVWHDIAQTVQASSQQTSLWSSAALAAWCQNCSFV